MIYAHWWIPPSCTQYGEEFCDDSHRGTPAYWRCIRKRDSRGKVFKKHDQDLSGAKRKIFQVPGPEILNIYTPVKNRIIKSYILPVPSRNHSLLHTNHLSGRIGLHDKFTSIRFIYSWYPARTRLCKFWPKICWACLEDIRAWYHFTDNNIKFYSAKILWHAYASGIILSFPSYASLTHA